MDQGTLNIENQYLKEQVSFLETQIRDREQKIRDLTTKMIELGKTNAFSGDLYNRHVTEFHRLQKLLDDAGIDWKSGSPDGLGGVG